jgi:hypothetical protein
MVLDVVMHYPGQWPLYLRYALHAQRDPRTAGDVLRFFGYFVRSAQPVALSVATIAIAAGLIATERDRERRRRFGSVYLIVGLQTVLTLVYIARGVDSLIPVDRYVGYFYEAAPMLLTVSVLCHVLLRVNAASDRPRGARRSPAIVALTAGASLILVTALAPHWVVDTGARFPQNNYPAIVAAIQDAPARAGRPVEFAFDHDSWPQVAGIAIQATREGLPYCLKDPGWALLFGADRICDPGASGERWQVNVGSSSAVPHGATVLWRGPDRAVFS